MPGRIRADVVAAVKERAAIEDVVRDHVTLRSAGVGSLKGLCPFHDEKSPSFHVRPHLGVWHCFGCGEGGDVISFVQRVDHLSFTEAVERLATTAGVSVAYDDDAGGRPRVEVGRRIRLVEANRVAQQWYAEQLTQGPEAAPARGFLAERGFDQEAAARFTVGYAPRSGEALLRHLRGRGFTDEEIVQAGLAARGGRGPYDRFRGRVLWPIRDVTGDCVGFGARRLYDDDRIEAKYLNTPETVLFKKSQVLYGLDLAKRAIAGQRRAVVVEGYTDVMACHLAGVDVAVATCGTAFGVDHVRVLRRITRDETQARPAEVIFTFDGDAAGRQAALRAFAEDQRFVAQTSVAIEPAGLDPCELRQQHGDQAVRDLVDRRVPLFEFALTSVLADFDVETAVGRVHGVQAAAQVVAQIKDPALRPEYVRRLAGLVGVDVEQARQAVVAAARVRASSRSVVPTRAGSAEPDRASDHRPGRSPDRSDRPSGQTPGQSSGRSRGQLSDPAAPRATAPAETPPSGPEARRLPPPDLTNPGVVMERQLLQCVLQAPQALDAAEYDALETEAFDAPMHRTVHQAIRDLGGVAAAQGTSAALWLEQVAGAVPDGVRGYVTDVAVAALPAIDEDQVARLAASLQVEIAHRDLVRREREVHSRMQRRDAAGDVTGYQAALREAQALVERRGALRARDHW
ncbi:MAG: DNA primase [Angustibacter sp.]